jgi:hypothetical protein
MDVDEMDGASSTHRREENCLESSVGESEEMDP